MKSKEKLLMAIIAVTLIIVLVGGATFAYWTWRSSTNTSVTFTVQGGSITIDGGGNITSKSLAPAACTNGTYAIQRQITVTSKNDTGTDMNEILQLKVTDLTPVTGRTLTEAAKQSIKWAIVKIPGTTAYAATTCSSPSSQGTFENYSTGSVIPLYTATGNAKANATTTSYYKLFIWIDSGYTGTTTVGTTVTDPLQELTLKLDWQGSMTNATS